MKKNHPLNEVSTISKKRAGAELKQKIKGKRSDGLGKYTATIYGMSGGKRVELKSLNDLNKYSEFEIDESVNEIAEPQIRKIAELTGVSIDKVEKYVSSRVLNITKLLQYIKDEKQVAIRDFEKAVKGDKKQDAYFIKMFNESVKISKSKVIETISKMSSNPDEVLEGLWDNVRKKKARGESPAKPGDKDYPDDKAWKDAQESVNEAVSDLLLSELSTKDILKHLMKARGIAASKSQHGLVTSLSKHIKDVRKQMEKEKNESVNESFDAEELYNKIKKDRKTKMNSDIDDGSILFYHKDIAKGKAEVNVDGWSGDITIEVPGFGEWYGDQVSNMKDIDKQIKRYIKAEKSGEFEDMEESISEDFNIGRQSTSERDRFMKFMFKNGEAKGNYKGYSVTVSTNGAKKDPRKWTVEFTKTGKSVKFIDTIDKLVVNEGKLTEIRKGDYIGTGKEIGLVNKVSGSGANQVAYVKFDSRPKSFIPILARNLTKTGKKHKGKDLYQEGIVNEAVKPIKLSGNLKKDLDNVTHMATKMVKYAKDNFNTYIPTGHMLSQLTVAGYKEKDVLKYNIAHLAKAINTDLKKKYMKDFMGESVNEGSRKKVTKSMWQKMSDDEKENALLTVFEDPDTAQKWIERKWNSLPGSVSRDMYTESVNEAQLQDLPIKSLLGLGKFATVSMGEKKLYKLSEAFEEWLIDNDDNTYEGITAHLDMAIELIQEREKKEAVPHMNKFNKACGKALSRLK